MGENFSKVKIGTLFTTSDGETFKKTSDLTYDDSIGIEHHIGSEFGFDKKIGAPPAGPRSDVNVSARIAKDSEIDTDPRASGPKKPQPAKAKNGKKAKKASK
jgi:hypothetical protein